MDEPTSRKSVAISAGRMSFRTAQRERASCSSTCLATLVASSTSARATAACSPFSRSIVRRCSAWASTSPSSCSRRHASASPSDERVELVEHDLAEPLPALGRFDAVVSSFAIHHLEHERKRSLYGEVFDLLEPGGVFANFEHVASATHRLHLAFFAAIDEPLENEDPSDRLLDVETQLGWLRELGFDDVDCYWKWLEMALLIGVKPAQSR